MLQPKSFEMRLYIKLIIVVLGFFNLELSMLYGQSLNTDSLELIVSKQRGIEKLKTLQNLANYYVDNAPEKAIIFAKEALTIAESLDSLYYNDLTYQLLGEAFFYQDDTANAGYYFRNLLELRIKEGDKLKIGNAYNNLGILARSSSQYDVALVYYNKALNLKSELKDSFSISSTLNNIGVVYEYQGKYKDAFKSYEAALEMAIKIGDIEGVATGHLNIGALYRMDGDYINALLRLNKCLDIVDTVDLGIIKEMAFEQKYLLYKSIGDHKQALHYHEKYYEL